MLTGNNAIDRIEYLRLAAYEVGMASHHYGAGNDKMGYLAMQCAHRYLDDAEKLK